MKARMLIGVIVLIIAVSTAVFADEEHHKDDDSQQLSSDVMQSAGMPMMDMKKMHERMSNMQKTMDKIHNTENTNEKTKLMQQHMTEMHKGMGMMQGMMMPGKLPQCMPGQMRGKQMPGKMRERMEKMDDDGRMPCDKDMMKRHNMMEHMMQKEKMTKEMK